VPKALRKNNLNRNVKGDTVPIGILYSHYAEHGGAENVILMQADMLNRLGYSVKCYFAYVDKSMVKPSSNPHCFIDEYFGDSLPHFKTARILLSIPLAPLTGRKLADASVLICHGYGPASWIGYVQKKLRGIKYITYVDFLPKMFISSSEEKKLWRFDKTRNTVYMLSRIMEPLVKKIDHLGMTGSDVVLANSQFNRRRIKRIYGVESIVLYPPVDGRVFRRLAERELEPLRKQFGWPLIFSSGRIVAFKRWEWLITALPYIKKSYPSVTLAIAGEAPSGGTEYVVKLNRLAENLGVKENVKFLGFRPVKELVRLYNATDVYAFVSPKEDFGLGPAEAIFCGTPSVVWDDGGGPCETVVGQAGFRAEPYDLEDFAEKTMKAFDVDKQSISDYLHQHAEKFSYKRHSEILEKTLRSV
jgi:glycosyltransferase involved in cell wall biosynthesis